MELLRNADIDMAALAGKRVAVLGFGNQGRAQSLNLKDSGMDVVVGLRGASGSTELAEAAGLRVALVEFIRAGRKRDIASHAAGRVRVMKDNHPLRLAGRHAARMARRIRPQIGHRHSHARTQAALEGSRDRRIS